MAARRVANDGDSILEAAVGEFLERGYDATRLEHIAEAASLSKSSVYHHVAGKEDLLRRGLDRALDGLARCFGSVEDSDADPGTRLATLVEAIISEMLDDERLPYVALLVRVHGNSAVEQEALERRRSYDARLAELIAECQTDGAVRGDIAASTLARLVFGTINSLLWVRSVSASARADVAADARRFVLSALQP